MASWRTKVASAVSLALTSLAGAANSSYAMFSDMRGATAPEVKKRFHPKKSIPHNFRLWNRAELLLGAPNAPRRDENKSVFRHTTTQNPVKLWPLEVGIYTAHLIRNVNGVCFDSVFESGFFIACRSRFGFIKPFLWGLAGSLFSS